MERLEPEYVELLEKQNSRLVSEFRAQKLETEARKSWDLFYKRNQTKFFKDRHWTTREFQELTGTVKALVFYVTLILTCRQLSKHFISLGKKRAPMQGACVKC